MAAGAPIEAFALYSSAFVVSQHRSPTSRGPGAADAEASAAASGVRSLGWSHSAVHGQHGCRGHRGLLGTVATVAVVAAAATTSRRGRRRAVSRVPCRASMTQEQQELLALRTEQAEAAIEKATPVPESFEDAVALACKATMAAAEAGNKRQNIYFDAGEGDSDIGGVLGRVLPFAEAFAKAMTAIQAAKGGKVRVVFNDMGGKSICENRWAPLPPGLALDYFPAMTKQQTGEGRVRAKLDEILDADVIIPVATTQNEMPALLTLAEMMKQSTRRDVPIVLINPKLIQDATLAAGSQMREIMAFAERLLPSFHLEQVEPPDESGLNPGVVCRVWPQPFSVWEDNEDDPEAIDGFFLLDLSDTEAPSPTQIKDMLKTSMEIASMPSLPAPRL
mmetsp:Transcript_32898/g.83307  ORF Transcript_32898/g.83307 Transcript_32898/m.83307 type:complete len:391 (-) Transcript_32898:69-1241(-)